jgi:hypothetical protein
MVDYAVFHCADNDREKGISEIAGAKIAVHKTTQTRLFNLPR